MRRKTLAVAVGCLAVFLGTAVFLVGSRPYPASRLTRQQAELRFQLCQPRHWRSCLLQQP